MAVKEIEIYSDGASRGNPGDAAYAFVFVDDGEIVDSDSGFLGQGTNNQAEYYAVINALEHALDQGVSVLRIHSDSKLLVSQLNNVWRVKDETLKQLHKRVETLQGWFEEVSFEHLPRENEYIAAADRLCNETLDAEQ